MEEEISKSDYTKELTGKIALITGASRGIGRGIARKLASLGATVLVNYNGSEQKAQELAEEIAAAGDAPNASAVMCPTLPPVPEW